MRCPKCHSNNVIEFGAKLMTEHGYVTPVKCTECGKVFTEKFERKIEKWHRVDSSLPKAVVQIKDGVIVGRYSSINTAAKLTGFNKSSISRAANEKLHTAGGYEWKWDYEVEDD